MLRNYIEDVREQFRHLKRNKSESKGTYEIQCATFICDENHIFGEPNEDYIKAELEWYQSQSRRVADIARYYGKVPKIWQDVASDLGEINSNYGWCIYSQENGLQYDRVRCALWDNPDTRHAVMYYTRPSIHNEWNNDGMSDHICTLAVQYHLNNQHLDAHVYMRSNDAIYGFNNDFAWQEYVLEELCGDLSHAHNSVKKGDIIWNVSSLHIYPRHYDLIV